MSMLETSWTRAMPGRLRRSCSYSLGLGPAGWGLTVDMSCTTAVGTTKRVDRGLDRPLLIVVL